MHGVPIWLPGAEGRQPDGRAKGAVHPLGSGTHRGNQLTCRNRNQASAAKRSVCPAVGLVCLDQERGRKPTPLRAFLGGLEGNLEVCRGRGTKQDNPKTLPLPAVRRASEPPGVARPGERIYPPSGGASRAFGLPQAAAKRILRAEARTHFPVGATPRG